MTGPAYKYLAYVERVVDGDTLDLAVDLGFRMQYRTRVRVAGIDCPELATDAGKAARAFVVDALDRLGLDVLLESQKPDKYGRALGRITLAPASPGPVDLADALLRDGHARPYSGGAR